MTSEELEILADLRGIKEEARVIRVHLANMHSDWRLWIQHPGKPEIPGTAKPYLKRLAELKTQWRDQAQAYEKARRRRMIALGHEPP